MTIHTDAIFEGGMLRPLTPLDLPEHQRVSIAISAPTTPQADDGVVEQQRSALLRYIERIELEEREAPSDGFSNRDHDRLIYGNADDLR